MMPVKAGIAPRRDSSAGMVYEGRIGGGAAEEGLACGGSPTRRAHGSVPRRPAARASRWRARNVSDRTGDGAGGIQSLDAALRLLLAMARKPGPTGLSELARECGMPASKTHRYLTSFAHAGLVRQSGRSGKYDLGAAALEIGLAALQRHDFVNRVSDELPALSADTNLTALLCVWGNSGPTVVRWERTTAFVVTSLGLGTTLPLLSSATGRVFLAYLPEAVTERLLDEELERAKASARLFPDLVPSREGVRDLTAAVRERGVATVDGRFIPGLVAASAPVLDWQGQAQAAVTLIGTDPGLIAPRSSALARLVAFCADNSVPKRSAI